MSHTRRIVATIELEQSPEEGASRYSTWDQLVETKISITLPVPNPDALPFYLAEQIRGFLDIATGEGEDPSDVGGADEGSIPSAGTDDPSNGYTTDELNAELDPDVDSRAVPA